MTTVSQRVYVQLTRTEPISLYDWPPISHLEVAGTLGRAFYVTTDLRLVEAIGPIYEFPDDIRVSFSDEDFPRHNLNAQQAFRLTNELYEVIMSKVAAAENDRFLGKSTLSDVDYRKMESRMAVIIERFESVAVKK